MRRTRAASRSGVGSLARAALRFVEPELSAVLKGRLHRNAKSMLRELVQA